MHKRASSTREATRSKSSACGRDSGVTGFAGATEPLKASQAPHATNPASTIWMTVTIVETNASMVRLPQVTGDIQKQELEPADAAHELLDGRRGPGRLAQLAMHGRKRRKDRGELLRHVPGGFARCGEEEFDARARIADLDEQVIEAVHGAQATPARRPA